MAMKLVYAIKSGSGEKVDVYGTVKVAGTFSPMSTVEPPLQTGDGRSVTMVNFGLWKVEGSDENRVKAP